MHCAPGSQPGTLCSWLFGVDQRIACVNGWRAGEGGLLHRLDAATSGLVAFASDDESFRMLTQFSDSGNFIKSYRAKARPSTGGLTGSRPLLGTPQGKPESEWISAIRRGDTKGIVQMLHGTAVVARFRPFGPGSVRVACALPGQEQAPGGHITKRWTKELYRTVCNNVLQAGETIIADVSLTRGFRHQVRAHLAWIGLPLEGDPTYGSANDGDILYLRAYKLSFPDPHGGSSITVELGA
jgi:23S rRNA pseudouridine1911/1915/1917 synthase